MKFYDFSLFVFNLISVVHPSRRLGLNFSYSLHILRYQISLTFHWHFDNDSDSDRSASETIIIN
jgi:hypothetical protein